MIVGLILNKSEMALNARVDAKVDDGRMYRKLDFYSTPAYQTIQIRYVLVIVLLLIRDWVQQNLVYCQ